jgi:hypothetical protein
MMRENVATECHDLKELESLTRAGLFKKGRDLLFSADNDTLPARLALEGAVKADADPARRATERAANFTMVSSLIVHDAFINTRIFTRSRQQIFSFNVELRALG